VSATVNVPPLTFHLAIVVKKIPQFFSEELTFLTVGYTIYLDGILLLRRKLEGSRHSDLLIRPQMPS